MKHYLAIIAATLCLQAAAQQRYSNPILHQDWSDPDVCRVGEDYYMTASSFNFFPGLPILHSRDLVHWKQVGAALTCYPCEGDANGTSATVRDSVEHGGRVWAPSIRYRDGWFYIFAADPDRGVFMVRTQDPAGPWEAPVWVVRAKGFIDPCPLWDDDGKTYLSHAAAGSRAGLKSIVFVAPMAPDGTHLLGPSRIVFDGHETQPTIEGTKFYKRDGWYYLFCPAGGVTGGWQTVLRSRSPWGPWEEKIVLASAPGTINGPHQGGWVDAPDGSGWFIHFQDKGAYGRIVHLQPLTWRADGWPLIGTDPDGDGIGQPVENWSIPQHGGKQGGKRPEKSVSNSFVYADSTPAAGPYGTGLEWQYPCVPSPYWHYALPGGGFRLYSVEQQDLAVNLWNCPNLLGQKFPAESFSVCARMSFRPNPALKGRGEQAGFYVTGNDYAGLRMTDTPEGARLEYVECIEAAEGTPESVRALALIPWEEAAGGYSATILVKLEVHQDAVCTLSWSTGDGSWNEAARGFRAKAEMWTGARFSFCCNRYAPKNDSGWVDVTGIEMKY